ncbi:MAG: FtsX-like permease family protein [Pedosphaera sp.]|nr:FtsX-like permease family protein [Pedosphaera sp.]
MRFFAILKIAFRALRRNLMRTLLTMLGIIFGILAVIAGVSMGAGAKAQVEARIAGLGQNVVQVMSGNVSRGGFRMGFGSAPTLTQSDFESIRADVNGINGVSPEVRAFAQVAAGNQNNNIQVQGVDVPFVEIRSWPIINGVNFSEADIRNAGKVALIGKTASKTLFGDGGNPVGQIIRIKNAPFTIIGELAAKGTSGFGSDQDDTILVPYTSAMKRLSGQTTFRMFYLQASSPALLDNVKAQVGELLRDRHKIAEGKDPDFMVMTQQELSDTMSETSRIMTIVLGVIASVSLLVGGIGIMNIMLVSVTERTREIGVRLAVGARGGDVLMQFLTEAVVLSVVGGGLGVLAGIGCAHLLTRLYGFPTLVSNSAVVGAFLVSAAIGIFFGFYPARKAAKLDPIDALRFE